MSSSAPAIHVPQIQRMVLQQLLVACDRERRVTDAVAEELGADAVVAVERARRRCSLPACASVLPELVAAATTHEALADLVSRVHRREASGWMALVALAGDEAEVRLRMAAEEHGREAGGAAAEQHGRGKGGAGAAFDLLGTSLLEQLPCESRVRLVAEAPGRIRWTRDACPWKHDWEAEGLSLPVACGILSAWIRGFASGCDAALEYRRPRAIAAGDSRCEHELALVGP